MKAGRKERWKEENREDRGKERRKNPGEKEG